MSLIKRSKKALGTSAAIILYFASDNAVHEIYNSPELMKERGLDITDARHFRYLGINCYISVLGVK
ncbi:hypothetical protein ACFOEK_19150 [Litoribrevibacter euphylliae]|uniref:Uncharacterized protein n=1 Tax=Litoribrevibacter euphylliae TaxID=1834034 RepID=A0ABV7HH14_9GAMM